MFFVVCVPVHVPARVLFFFFAVPAGTKRKTTKMNGEVHSVHTKHTTYASRRVGIASSSKQTDVTGRQPSRKGERMK